MYEYIHIFYLLYIIYTHTYIIYIYNIYTHLEYIHIDIDSNGCDFT